jgi:hypothetical protein
MAIVLFAVTIYFILKSGRSFARKRLTIGYMVFSLALTTTWFIAGTSTASYMLVRKVPDDVRCSTVVLTTSVTAMLQFLSSDILLVRTTSLDTCTFRQSNKGIGISRIHGMGEEHACSVRAWCALPSQPRYHHLHLSCMHAYLLYSIWHHHGTLLRKTSQYNGIPRSLLHHHYYYQCFGHQCYSLEAPSSAAIPGPVEYSS